MYMHSSGHGCTHKSQYIHSDISMVNLGTIIFFLVSFEVIPQSKSLPLAGLIVSILIQSTGQALSHCKHPIQSSIST